jgi:phosphoglycerate dehydrogenase-like enzyme
VFVNNGRGKVVDEEALGRVAQAEHLFLALDVFSQEPLPIDSPFRGLPNVTLMPHAGGPTPDRYPHCGRFALDNLIRFEKGEVLLAELTLTAYDLST